MSTYEHWTVSTQDHITTLRMNRVAVMNSLTPDTLFELRDITRHLNDDEATWAVILEAAGKHFSAGVDVHVIADIAGQDEETFANNLRDMQDCLDTFELLDKPVIAKLRGYCIGGGLLLALCCDFRIADTTAHFYLPEVKLGLAVIMGTQRITRLVGIAAAEMILLAEPFDAAQAQRYGLLTDLVEPGTLDAAVDGFAEKFRHLPPRTVAIARHLIEASDRFSLRESQELEIRLQAELIHHPDLAEGVRAFFEKRQPHFTG